MTNGTFLETERLVFRRFATADLTPVVEMMTDPVVFTRTGHSAWSQEEAERWFFDRILVLQERYEHLGFRAATERASGQYVGHIGVLPQVVEEEEFLEVGYWLSPAFWGLGYATEGARAFRDFAFRRLDADPVISLIHPDNEPSQNVARRNEMRQLREVSWRGKVHLMFGVSRSDWIALSG